MHVHDAWQPGQASNQQPEREGDGAHVDDGGSFRRDQPEAGDETQPALHDQPDEPEWPHRHSAEHRTRAVPHASATPLDLLDEWAAARQRDDHIIALRRIR